MNYSLFNKKCCRYPYNTKYGTDKDDDDVNSNNAKVIMTHVNNTTYIIQKCWWAITKEG